ncbi:MAG: esterase-like activity of phytase family protein [Candidatus Eiseniibacteriota bacterium]
MTVPPARAGRAGVRLIVALAALVLAAGLSSAAFANPVEISAQPLPLSADRPAEMRVGRLDYRGGLALSAADRRFGGFSALSLSRDGSELLALTRRGSWLKAKLRYDKDGRLIGIGEGEMGALVGTDGRPLRRTLAKAMAAIPAGVLVAFGDTHRLWLYPAGDPPFGHKPAAFRQPPGLSDAPRNGGISALTRLNDGRILTIAEKLPAPGKEGAKANAAWVGGAPGWRTLSYQRTEAYLPTDAATLPPATRWEGGVVVTERSFNIVDGYSVRLALVPFDQIRPGHRMVATELARFKRPLTLDNADGIAARRGPNGETLLYVITNDNYSPVQRTLLQMFELKE